MNYWFFRMTAAAARVVPRRVLLALARLLALIYWLVNRRGVATVAANLQRISGFRGQPLDPTEARGRALKAFTSFAKTVTDYFYFGAHSEELLSLVDVENIEVLARTRALGRGTIIVSAHLGSVENGAALVAHHGFLCSVVALSQATPRLDELFQRQRFARGMRIIPIGRATRECVRAMQRNEFVALVGDRDFTPNRETTMFFGAPARLPTGAARLALRFGAPIAFCFCVRLPDDRFKLFFYDAIFVDPARDTQEGLCRQLAERLERAIGEHADQWHVFNDLWDVDADWRLAQVYQHPG